MVERVRGRPDAAIKFHKRAQQFYQNESIHAHLPQTLNSLAAAEMEIGTQDSVEALLMESLEMARTLGNIFDQAVALALLAKMKLARDQPNEASVLSEKALLLTNRSGAAPLALQILCDVARLLVHSKIDHPEEATALLRYVADHPAAEADTRRQAVACLVEFDTVETIADLTGQDIWSVVAGIQSNLADTI